MEKNTGYINYTLICKLINWIFKKKEKEHRLLTSKLKLWQ